MLLSTTAREAAIKDDEAAAIKRNDREAAVKHSGPYYTEYVEYSCWWSTSRDGNWDAIAIEHSLLPLYERRLGVPLCSSWQLRENLYLDPFTLTRNQLAKHFATHFALISQQLGGLKILFFLPSFTTCVIFDIPNIGKYAN